MAAAAAVGSCFSSSTLTSPCIQSKHVVSEVLVLRIHSLLRTPSVASTLKHFSLSVHKSRLPRISAAVAQDEVTAAVAQEEVTATAETESTDVKEEEEEGEEKGEGEGEVVADAPPPPVNTKLYFGNLPYNCDSAQLAGVIQEYGSPEMVEVLYDRDTGRSRGFAFVTMSSVEDCEAVIQNLDGSQYSGRTLRVNYADKPKPKEPLYPETEYKLFVGNLSWSVTSESLTQVFQEYGNVVGARVLYDGDTGHSRGYGFVCYSSKAEMDAAVESLNGVELEGRTLRISLALGKRS